MNRYAVFLRGINVGGNAAINMAALKTNLMAEGFWNVETYLNSGNISLKTEKNSPETEKAVAQIIEKYFGQQIAVFVKSKNDLERIIADNPFDAVLEPDNSKRMVVMFYGPVTDTPEMSIYKNDNEDADYYLKENHMYIYYKVGAGKAKITNPVIRKLLKQTSTARNWNTITKMFEKI